MTENLMVALQALQDLWLALLHFFYATQFLLLSWPLLEM